MDEATGKIDLLKLSLSPQYSRFIEINYVLGKSRISCMKNSQPDYIEIEKILEPDFPDLTKLREKVSLYVIFSWYLPLLQCYYATDREQCLKHHLSL